MDKIEEWFEGSYRIYLKGINTPYEISRRYLAKIKDIMG
jgi:DNA-binding LytR/AlgR family response regulator